MPNTRDSKQPMPRVIETWLERALFSARWLLAPFYFGLAISLGLLLIKFMGELGHMIAHVFKAGEKEVIVDVLSLVDLALTGSLVVIVIFSGYENFVSKIDHSNHEDWPEWMGTIDFSALKLKLLSSIVAISAIQLLRQFMMMNESTNERHLMWLVVIHVVFVVSSVLLALSDRISGHGSESHKPPGGDSADSTTPAKDAVKPTGTTPGKKH